MTGETLPWLDEDEVAREHPKIFHYTSERNLPSILQSGGLFATRYSDTNDPNELHALRNPLIPFMMQSAAPVLRFAVANIDEPPSPEEQIKFVRDRAEMFHDSMVRNIPFPLHMTCFSAHVQAHHRKNGLLSMWRLYGGGGEGIAFGFDTAKMIQASTRVQDSLAINTIYLDPVLYGLDDPRLIRRLLDAPSVVEIFANYMIANLRGEHEPPQPTNETFWKFVVLVCGAKHPDFSDEREIRLVVGQAIESDAAGRPFAASPVSGRIVVPYLEALTDIMVGPSADQESKAARVRRALDDAGMQRVGVVRSDTQFRFVENS